MLFERSSTESQRPSLANEHTTEVLVVLGPWKLKKKKLVMKLLVQCDNRRIRD